MSAPAVKPALPATGGQAPKVATAAPPPPPALANNPALVGPKVMPSPANLNKPMAPTNANHATVGAMPLSLVQDHKAASGMNQPIPRTPEKAKEHTQAPSLGVKPTSNGVEGSPNRPNTAPEAKKVEDSVTPSAAAVMNHSAEVVPVAATPSPPQGLSTSPPVQQTPLAPVVAGAQPSVTKSQQAAVTTSVAVTNHSTLLGITSKLDGTTVEGKPSLPAGTEPPLTTASQVTPTPPAPTSTQPQVQHPPPQPQEQPSQQKQQQPPAQQQPSPPQQQQQPTPTPPPPPQQPPPQPASAQQSTPQPAAAQQVPAAPQQEVPADTLKPRIEAPKPEYKVATPPRTNKRKRDVKPAADAAKIPSSDQDDRKSKRVRTQTQPYQSPLPELTYIAKLKTMMKSPDDKLIVFYKNEFLAVRNAEGSFYICQAMQNIYKSSPRIRIRWLSQEKKDSKGTDIYTPDFYDATDFDCILTNLELKKLDKNRFQLPDAERERTQSILKRAIDVEKGVSEKPSVTEEHPDGLDLSLFRDESQLKKKSLKRAAPKKKENADVAEDDTKGSAGEEEEGEENTEDEEEVKKKKAKPNKKVEKPKASVKDKVKTKEKPVEKRVERASERGRDRGLAAKRRSDSAASAATTVVKNFAAKVAAVKQTVARQPATKPSDKKSRIVAKITKKPEPVAEVSIPTRSAKTRSVKVASQPQPKSSPVTRTKERERRGVVRGRKKPVKKA